MKRIWRCGVILCLLVQGLSICQPGLGAGLAFAQPGQQKPVFRRAPGDLPFYRLAREIAAPPYERRRADPPGLALHYVKLQFAPVKILSRGVPSTVTAKKRPLLARPFQQGKLLPPEELKTTQPGIVIELEPGYGINKTFMGRLQNGVQFKGAHYYVNGHGEQTAGKRSAEREETLAAQAKVDVDLSAQTKISLDSTYFQSDQPLPQLPDDPRQQKSAIQLIAGLQVKFEPDIDFALAVSGEKARLTDQQGVTFDLNGYGAQLTVKQLWSLNNIVSFHAQGYRDAYLREAQLLSNRFYGTSALTNAYAFHDRLTVEAGVQCDYYQAPDLPETEYLVTPVVTTRLHLFRNTVLYAAYHPQLKFPRFTDLYIRKLYTTVNPDLFAEQERHAVEAGIQQRMGDSVVLNAGLFYHQSQHLILQIDANADQLLEYDQSASADVMGVKVNLQTNYKEQFVQNITYTYTKYHFADAAGPSAMLPYQPYHQVQASLYWKTPFGLTIDCSGTYVSEQARNWDRTQPPIGPRFFLNANLTQHITDNFQIFLLGRNLTDTSTYDIIPILDSEEITSSRLFIGGIRLRF